MTEVAPAPQAPVNVPNSFLQQSEFHGDTPNQTC